MSAVFDARGDAALSDCGATPGDETAKRSAVDAPSPAIAERRLSPTERLHEVTMAAMNRQPREPECSVDLSLNAKGDVQITVSAKGADVAAVGAAAQAEFDRLRLVYPRANGAA